MIMYDLLFTFRSSTCMMLFFYRLVRFRLRDWSFVFGVGVGLLRAELVVGLRVEVQWDLW